jgi:spermidine synthase
VKPFELLEQTVSPDGTAIKLMLRGDEYLILADGAILMSSRMHGSEEALASCACENMQTLECPRVLIGGLGMGFTLRATLDLLPQAATILVVELLPMVVEWNRGPLGPLAGHPLKDKRVEVIAGDVLATIRSSSDKFDAVLLDVDNGPAAFTASNNAGLYDKRGIAEACAALKPQGILAVWAAQADRKFEQRLRDGGFQVQVHHPRGRLKKGGPRHTIFLSHKS